MLCGGDVLGGGSGDGRKARWIEIFAFSQSGTRSNNGGYCYFGHGLGDVLAGYVLLNFCCVVVTFSIPEELVGIFSLPKKRNKSNVAARKEDAPASGFNQRIIKPVEWSIDHRIRRVLASTLVKCHPKVAFKDPVIIRSEVTAAGV